MESAFLSERLALKNSFWFGIFPEQFIKYELKTQEWQKKDVDKWDDLNKGRAMIKYERHHFNHFGRIRQVANLETINSVRGRLCLVLKDIIETERRRHNHF